ncbi:MAG: ribosome maturation factor RimM [Pseudomonadota bacterium]
MGGQTNEWVCVAAVANAHGIRGTLKLRCFTEQPEDAASYGPVHDEHGKRLFSLKVVGEASGGVLAKAEGIDDRNAAEALRGIELFVPRSALPELGPEEYYQGDLEGLTVRSSEGATLGVVRAVSNFGAGDVVEVLADNGKTYCLPFDRATVRQVDLKDGLLVEPPQELVAEAAS